MSQPAARRGRISPVLRPPRAAPLGVGRRLVSFLLLLFSVAACSAGGSRARVNVVLVSIDTLRADAVGAYGGPVQTPALDRLAAGGVLFEQAIAAAPETSPSHATLFTGREVERHGLVHNGLVLDDEVVTLAEVFRTAGYATGGFVSSFVLDPRFGWSQGFDRYDATFPREGESVRHRDAFWSRYDFAGFDRRAAETNREVLRWLEGVREPFFLFVHYFDPHAPYGGHPRLQARVPRKVARNAARRRIGLLQSRFPRLSVEDLERMIRGYHAEVLYVDGSLAELLGALEARGVRERTLVVATADHGEGLGQHGVLDHSPHLYEEQLRVPLILQGPAGLPRGLRIRTPVGLVDLAPTVAELAGVDFPRDSDGRSLAASLRAGVEPRDRPLVGRRRRYPKPFLGHRGIKFFVRTAAWKYIRATEDPDELYRLETDRGEQHDVHSQHPEVVARLGRVLDAHLASAPDRGPAPELSEEVQRGLEALGYLE